MKKIIFAILIGSSISTVYGQKVKTEDVPLAVKNEFKKHFPTAKVKSWEKEGTNFEAEFDVNKIDASAIIDANGNLLETESEIAISGLPKTAVEYLTKTYKGEKIKEAAKIVEANGRIKFEAEIKGKDILFDENGNVL